MQHSPEKKAKLKNLNKTSSLLFADEGLSEKDEEEYDSESIVSSAVKNGKQNNGRRGAIMDSLDNSPSRASNMTKNSQ